MDELATVLILYLFLAGGLVVWFFSWAIVIGFGLERSINRFFKWLGV